MVGLDCGVSVLEEMDVDRAGGLGSEESHLRVIGFHAGNLIETVEVGQVLTTLVPILLPCEESLGSFVLKVLCDIVHC